MEKVEILKTVKIINETVKKFDGKRNFLSTGDLDLSVIKSFEEVTYFEKPSRANQNVKKGDIILARMQGTVKVKIIDFNEEDIIVSTGFLVLRCNKDIDNRYLFHYLKSNLFQSKKDRLCSGATQKAINNNKFAEIKIPLTDLPTQQKIAAILDKAEELRQYNKQLIAKYDALTQSLFLDMFGDVKLNIKNWKIHHLEDICSHIIDCPHSTPTFSNKLTEFPCIRTSELKNGEIDWSKMKYLNEENHTKRISRLKPIEGDIIYGREGTFGEAAIIPKNVEMSLGQRVMLFRAKSDIINNKFLHAVIRSKDVYNQALKVNTGSTVGHVNVKDIKKFKIIVPSLALQNQFAERVQFIETQKNQARDSMAKSELLFQGLLQQAFKGDLN